MDASCERADSLVWALTGVLTASTAGPNGTRWVPTVRPSSIPATSTKHGLGSRSAVETMSPISSRLADASSASGAHGSMTSMSAKVRSMVQFETLVSVVGSTTIVRLPGEVSRDLPSRGQVPVHGTLNGHEFQTVVEPDGLRGHWIRILPDLQKTTGLVAGRRVSVAIDVTREWPEPEVPLDLETALEAAPAEVQERWRDITPTARWEWVRWVNATANSATRERRIEVSISKLDSGKRRPCCFDLSACTDPSVSKSGKLLIGE